MIVKIKLNTNKRAEAELMKIIKSKAPEEVIIVNIAGIIGAVKVDFIDAPNDEITLHT